MMMAIVLAIRRDNARCRKPIRASAPAVAPAPEPPLDEDAIARASALLAKAECPVIFVGGGANAEQVKNAFRILLSDKEVKAVLINIFGGILRCDVLAQGVIAAVKELGVPVPIVIRMEGTNVEEGKRLLKESGMNFTTADSMGEAASTVVRLAH